VTVPGREHGELHDWPPIGRPVRTGSWTQQAEATPDRIERAVADGRASDAVALVRHLPVEAEEIHALYSDWSARIPTLIGEPAPDPARHDAAWQAFVDACQAWQASDDLAALLDLWAVAHDRHLQQVADLIDRAVEVWGEQRLGALWAELQRDAIAFYRATYGPDHPWSASAERLVQVAIEGMHGHLGGPRRRGEVTVVEHDDRVSLSFDTCGSGGRILEQGRNGVVEQVHDFAWSTPGVCRYCVHCCVLQQLTPIDDFGYPARVVDPPTRPGGSCTWTVYRDPSLVPDEAYRRVGRNTRGDE
jgi:hypothetical protein